MFILGDIHGNLAFLDQYIFPTAKGLGADAIVQAGDYGFWEHQPSGILFNDGVMDACARYDLPFYFLRGNHDKLSLLLQKYGGDVNEDGFIQIRPRLFYIPDGHTWTWGSQTLRAFGGAYSVDKDIRLETEERRRQQRWSKEHARRDAGRPAKDVPDAAGELWFPEEELADHQWKQLLSKEDGPIDVLLTHDKPHGVNPPGLQLKNEPDCLRNQMWIKRVINLQHPKLAMHGHLHHPYTASVEGSLGKWTTVVGLACDWDAAPRFVRPVDAWALLDIDVAGVPLQITRGSSPSLDVGSFVDLEGGGVL